MSGDKKTLAQRAKERQERVRQEAERAKLARREEWAQVKLDQQKKRKAVKEESERRKQEYQTKRAENSASSQAFKEERVRAYQVAKEERAQASRAKLTEIGAPSAARKQDRPVAVFDRVELWEDRIELCKSWRPKDRGVPADSRSLIDVVARIDDERVGGGYAGRDYRDVFLTISGPGFEWAIRTDAVFSSRQARVFAAKVNAASHNTAELPTAAVPSVPSGDDVTSRLEKLVSLHQRGLLTDEEFAAAKRQVLGG